MSGSFGNLSIAIPDGAAPSAPAAGNLLLYSDSGALKTVTNTDTFSYIAPATSNAGDLLVSDGTDFQPLAIGSQSQILTVRSGTLTYKNGPMQIYSGTTSISGTVTITHPAVNLDTIIIAGPAGGASPNAVTNPICVTNLSVGSFILSCGDGSVDMANYIFMSNEIPYNPPVYAGTVALTLSGDVVTGTVTNDAITSNTIVVANSLGVDSEYSIFVDSLSNGTFTLSCNDTAVTTATYMFQG